MLYVLSMVEEISGDQSSEFHPDQWDGPDQNGHGTCIRVIMKLHSLPSVNRSSTRSQEQIHLQQSAVRKIFERFVVHGSAFVFCFARVRCILPKAKVASDI